jgi:hypothetical protein
MTGLDPDPDLQIVLVITSTGMLADQRMQPGHTGRALAQPGPGQNPPGLVHQLNVMMISGPVITNKQNRHPRTSRSPWTTPAACGRTISDLMNSAHATGGHDIPAAICPPGHRRGHSLPTGLQPSPGCKCSPASGYQNPSLP